MHQPSAKVCWLEGLGRSVWCVAGVALSLGRETRSGEEARPPGMGQVWALLVTSDSSRPGLMLLS